MRAKFYLAALVIAASLGAVYFFVRLTPLVSQSAPPPGNLTQFRIIVGLKDTESRDWQGRLAVTGGEIASVQGWRFSQADRVGQDGSFAFRTKAGPLENQLDKSQPYGQTDWNEPRMRRLIPQGIVVQLRGAEPVTAKFESAAGARMS